MADIKSRLLLDNSQFNRNAKESSRVSAGLKAGLNAVGSAAKIAAAGIGIATTSLAFFVQRSVSYIDRLGKVSKTTGFAAETLQKFQFAAEQSGVTADNAALALRRFSRRLGEAQRSTGELFPALKKLGIETRDGNGRFKTAEEVLFEFADGIAKARNESEQLSLAFKAFDSEGAELVETLKDGASGLREFFNEAEDLGFVLTQQSIRGVEAFADEFNRLRKIIQGLLNQFTAALSPTLEKITNQFRDFIQLKIAEAGGLEEFGKYLKDTFIQIIVKVIQAVESITNAIIRFVNVIANLLNRVGKLPGINLEIFPELNEEPEAIKNIRKLAEETRRFDRTVNPEKLKELSLAILAFDKDMAAGTYEGFKLRQYAEDVGVISQALLDFAQIPILEEFGFTGQAINKFADPILAIADKIAQPRQLFPLQDFSPFIQMLLGDLETNKKAAEDMVEEIEEVVVKGQSRVGETLLGKIFGVGPVTDFWERWYAAGESALERFKAVAQLVLGDELIDKIKDAFANSDIGDFTKTLAEGLVKGVEMFEDSLADAIVNGKADFSSLADHLRQVLAKAMVQKFITGPIMGLFGLAKGGPAKAGQPYIVGEEGPELFVPGQSGTVVPNNQLGESGGAATTVNYNIQAVDAPSFQSLVARDPEFIYNVSRAGARRTPVA